MKCQIFEYDEQTGEITAIRTFDAQQIPWQPTAPGHAQMLVDPAIGEQIKGNPQGFKIVNGSVVEMIARQGTLPGAELE